MSDLEDVLNDLATRIAEDLKAEGVTLDQRLDAFKILAAHQTQLAKAKGKTAPAEDDDDGPDFGKMRRRIKSVS